MRARLQHTNSSIERFRPYFRSSLFANGLDDVTTPTLDDVTAPTPFKRDSKLVQMDLPTRGIPHGVCDVTADALVTS